MSNFTLGQLARGFILAFAFCIPSGLVQAAPVGPALDRPALMVKTPQGVVLLDMDLAGSRIVAVGERGVIIVSDDQGASWRQVPVPVSTELTALSFVDERNGWAVGHGGVVLATRDAGETWTKQFDGKEAAQVMLRAALQSGNEQARKEADWLVLDGADKPFLDVHFRDEQHGMIVGAYGLAFATADGGANWTSIADQLDNPGALHLYALSMRGDELLVAGEQGLVLYAAGRGKRFEALQLPYDGSFFAAELPSNGELIVAGLRGNVLRSTDGGIQWNSLEVPGNISANFNNSTVDRSGSVWLVNAAGMVFELRDGSLQLAKKRLRPLNDLLFLDNGTALGLSYSGVVHVPMSQGVKQ